MVVRPCEPAITWVDVVDQALSVDDVNSFCQRPENGAVVVFTGVVRDHAVDAEGVRRDGVQFLDYEAYEERARSVIEAIVDEARRRFAQITTVAAIHRVGRVQLGEVAVVVGVGAGHRDQAFDGARYVIDAIKASAPIWKKESWEHGFDWGTGASAPAEVAR